MRTQLKRTIPSLLTILFTFGINCFAQPQHAPSSLGSHGRYTLGKLSPAGPTFLLDTKNGRLWQLNQKALWPILFHTTDNRTKLKPEDQSDTIKQEARLSVQRQKQALHAEKNALKKAVATYLKFTNKTERLQNEITKALNTKSLNTAQKKIIAKSLASQNNNIQKVQDSLSKLLQPLSQNAPKARETQHLNQINQKLQELSSRGRKLMAAANQTSNKQTNPESEKQPHDHLHTNTQKPQRQAQHRRGSQH